jgi:hypothetical protein
MLLPAAWRWSVLILVSFPSYVYVQPPLNAFS